MGRPSGAYNVSYNQDMAILRTGLQWGLFIALMAALFLLPLLVQGYAISFLISIGITLIVAMGLNLLMGYCGQISVGQSAFMGVGGFAAALLVVKLGLSFWVALPLAGLIAGIVGMVFGAPSLRLKGLYLALATLAAQFIILFVIVRLLRGGSGYRVPAPSLGGFALDSDPKYYYLVLVVAILMTYFAKSLVRTRTGRAFVAIRDNDIAAETMGVSVFRYKLLAFFIGCFYAGIGGALWVYWLGVAQAEHYTLMESIWYLAIVVVGGGGSIVGTIFGTLFIRGAAEVAQRLAPAIGDAVPALAGNLGASLPLIFLGLAVVLFLIFEPRGLAHRWELFKASYRLHPFSY